MIKIEDYLPSFIELKVNEHEEFLEYCLWDRRENKFGDGFIQKFLLFKTVPLLNTILQLKIKFTLSIENYLQNCRFSQIYSIGEEKIRILIFEESGEFFLFISEYGYPCRKTGEKFSSIEEAKAYIAKALCPIDNRQALRL